MKQPPREKLVLRGPMLLPYGGGEIFGCELDSLYGYSELAHGKFCGDIAAFARPSVTALLAVNLLQTEVDGPLADCIASTLAGLSKPGLRVAFIADRRGKKRLREALERAKAGFAHGFFSGYEPAKEWLIPRGKPRTAE